MTVIFWRSAALPMKIYEKNPKNVQVVWPMTNGVIANLTEAEIVLSHLLKSFSGILHRDVALYIAVPSDITQVEKRAFFQVMRGKIGAGRIRLIDKGIADAVSVGAAGALASQRPHGGEHRRQTRLRFSVICRREDVILGADPEAGRQEGWMRTSARWCGGNSI